MPVSRQGCKGGQGGNFYKGAERAPTISNIILDHFYISNQRVFIVMICGGPKPSAGRISCNLAKMVEASN